jgi:hypothetical protein
LESGPVRLQDLACALGIVVAQAVGQTVECGHVIAQFAAGQVAMPRRLRELDQIVIVHAVMHHPAIGGQRVGADRMGDVREQVVHVICRQCRVLLT